MREEDRVRKEATEIPSDRVRGEKPEDRVRKEEAVISTSADRASARAAVSAATEEATHAVMIP